MQNHSSEDRNALAKRASLLHLSSIKLAEGMRSGSFKSLYYGRGIEFSGVREYLRGDDVRSIDWNVTARMGKPFVKIFDEERELNVFLIVDESSSMTTGSGKKSRLETAIECAFLLTLASEQNTSPVGAVLFDGAIHFSSAPKAGQNQSLLLLKNLTKKQTVTVNGSALDNALQGALKLLKKRTLVLVISDFRTSLWEKPFGQLCGKHDVVAIRITDSSDDELPEIGSIPFCDLETNYTQVIPTSSVQLRLAWREDNIKRVAVWKKECLKYGGIPLTISTDSDVAFELTNFFNSRERR
ncbi:MAG: DUF58 domain-containing protein [Treponema sp.]